MEQRSLDFIYLGFLIPSFFALTLVMEGIYKIYKHEEGFFTFLLGILFLLGLAFSYFFLLSK